MQIENILVIGGSNVDITGAPDTQFIPGDSNPGRVSISAGGVGRNIAENAARLGLGVSLVSVVGSDYFGNYLKAECSRAGINIENIITDGELPTSAYLCITDEHGEMKAAVNDMKIIDRITPEVIHSLGVLITEAELVVVDNNLSPATIEAVKAAGPRLLLFDAVSGKKLHRSIDAVRDIDTVKLNALEAEILAGIPVRSAADAWAAAGIILKTRNINRLFITLGAEGALYRSRKGAWFKKAFSLPLKNLTGAGDAFLAAVAYGLCHGREGQDLLDLGTACAAITAASEQTVSEKISINLVKEIIGGDSDELLSIS